MNNSERSTFGVLVSVFFFWGFVAASNDILIPVFKDAFNLENWQGQLVNFAFYGAYFVGSVVYMIANMFSKKDLIFRIGYQKSIALGLAVSALGTLLFIPAASFNSFGLMISGLFVVGLGFSLQQTAANPFAISLGDPKKGSQRLSLAGGVNNIGTTIAPMLISFAIFGSLKVDSDVPVPISAVQTPYLLLGLAFFATAALFFFTAKKKASKKDELIETTEIVVEKKALKPAIAHKQLWMGMLAIFFYVGVEVATAGNLGEYLKREMGMTDSGIGPFVALFWGSLMIGRWASSSAAFTKNNTTRIILKIILPFAAFGVFLLVNILFGKDVQVFLPYVFVILILILADFASMEKPNLQLLIFSCLGIVSLLIGIYATGMTAVFGLMSVGLFASTLWPCIFTIAISGLRDQTTRGSSLLIMMIFGGGVISVLQGLMADIEWIGISNSFYMGIICFSYLIIYALVAGPIQQRNLKEEEAQNA